MTSNGRLSGTALVTVQGSMQLSHPTSIAWKRLDAAAHSQLQRNISIAPPAGGYRTFAVQAAMREASLHGTRAQKRAWGLSTQSTASLAEPGTSNHGLGTCVDIIGTPMDSKFLALARKYGFTRPLPGDPNHFQHDGKTAIGDVPPIDFKELGRYLNGRKLGKKTATEETGEPDRTFWWLIQSLAHRDGRYPVPAYRIDGDPGESGSLTRAMTHYYWEKIR